MNVLINFCIYLLFSYNYLCIACIRCSFILLYTIYAAPFINMFIYYTHCSGWNEFNVSDNIICKRYDAYFARNYCFCEINKMIHFSSDATVDENNNFAYILQKMAFFIDSV